MANCPDMNKCYENVYKDIGVDPSDGISQEEQEKLAEWASEMGSGLTGICS